MNTEKQNDSFEKDLDRNNPNYVHNLFMRNADIWTDEHDWLMSIEIFKQVAEVLQSGINEISDESNFPMADLLINETKADSEPVIKPFDFNQLDADIKRMFSIDLKAKIKYNISGMCHNDLAAEKASEKCVEIVEQYAQSQRNNREANISLDKAIKILYENSEIETSKIMV